MNKAFLFKLFSCGETIAPATPTNLVIAYGGQSNAGNRGFVGSLTGEYSAYPGNYANTYYIDNGPSSYTARAVYNRSSGSNAIGADIGLVSQLSSEFTSIEIIKYFVGSTAIKDQNRPNNFYPYSPSAGLFTTGFYKNDGSSFWQTNLTAISQTKPNCIIWIQSEQDAVLNSTTYLADITAFVQAIRDGYNDQTIPFFYNKLHADYYTVDGVPQYPVGTANVRAAQVSFQSQYNKMIDMDDFPMGDTDGVNVHYGANALAEMGKRFAISIKSYYNIQTSPDLVILQFGQSNSSGWDFNYVNNGGYDLANSKFKVYYKTAVTSADNGTWQTFDCVTTNNNLNPINKPTQDSHGEELSLCNEIAELTGRNVYLIKLAAGATSLADVGTYDTGWGTWYPGSAGAIPYYDYFIDWYVRPALAKLSNPLIVAVTMHQGESDAINQNAANQYGANLITLWDSLESDLDLTQARKYICRVSNFSSGPYLNTVRTAQSDFVTANADDGFVLINTDDLPNNSTHFTMAGQETKGLRIFADLQNYLPT